MFFVLCGFIYTDVVVIRELIRVKALKWNATAYSLFFLLWAALGMCCVTLIYGLNIMGADRYDYWYNSRTPLFTYCLIPFSVIIDFEIGVTWIDLYDRTNKMSKSSSRALKVLKWFLRTAAFIMSMKYGSSNARFETWSEAYTYQHACALKACCAGVRVYADSAEERRSSLTCAVLGPLSKAFCCVVNALCSLDLCAEHSPQYAEFSLASAGFPSSQALSRISPSGFATTFSLFPPCLLPFAA